jgi:hypothetical protein
VCLGVCRQRMPKSISDRVDIVLYLDVDPSECHRRVTRERKNDAEEGIPFAYLNSVDEVYFHLMMDWMSGIDCKSSDFTDTNFGAPPPLLVLAWDEYGTTEYVLDELDKLSRKQRRVPAIRFAGLNEEADIKLDTQAQVDELYRAMKSTSIVTAVQGRTLASINWRLSHSNAYRRVTFALLSQCLDITFYGR